MIIKQLQTGCLSHFAYYIESHGEAAIIDPLRETAPYLTLLQEQGSQLKYVFETHFHADFISGHIDLAKETGAQLVFGEKANPQYEIYNAKDGEILKLGELSIKVIPTPGHTVESVSYLLFDENGKEYAIFTGDALFVGDVGRPDLSRGDLSQEDLASLMYDTIQKQFKPLSNEVIVYPAHGQGSSCGKQLGPETFSTLGEQKKSNYALQDMSREEFIKKVTDGLGKPPAYFFEAARINMQGYENIDTVMDKNINPLTVEELKTAQDEGALILDTRKPERFEKGSIPGAWNISLRGNYAPWVGALIPFGTKIVLICDEGEQAEAVMRLARVGYEQVVGYLRGGIQSWKEAGESVSEVAGVESSSLPKLINDIHPQILDVRTEGEFNKSHMEGALNIPLDVLQDRLDKLDKDRSYLVHCAGGYRSMVACSLLQSEGFQHVTNLKDGYQAGFCIRHTS